MVTAHARSRRRLGGWLAALVALALGVVSARAHSNPPGCTGSGLGISLFSDKLDAHVGETICYSALVFVTPFPACQAENITAGIVTPDGVTNRITLRRTTLNPSDSDFYTNVVCYVVRAQDVRADGTVRATAFDNGTIHQNDTDSQGGGFQGVNTEIAFPCILVTKQCVGGVGENGLITYSGTVVNCGNVPLSNVTVTNFVNGVFSRVIGPISLATNQTVSFQGSYVPLNPCGPVTDTLFAQGTDSLSFPSNVVSSASATCANVLTPGLRVTKTCPAPVAPGQLLVYSGTVVNTGNVTLTNVVVVSDLPSPNSTVFTVATLAPGATANFSGNYVAPTNCASTSTLIARAASVCGVAVTDTVSSTCPIVTNPQIVVTALCPTSPVSPAGLLTFSGTVRNAGDITLSNVVVTTDRPAANTVVFTTATLAPGATVNFTGSYNVGADVCSTTTRLTATGRDICTATAVSNATSITCPIITNPRVAVTLACPATPVATGAAITYNGTVSNPGNVTLNNVVVANAGTSVFNVATLAPGASANFSFTSGTPADSCSATTQVTASATDTCVATVVTNTASVTCPLVTTPRIVITQTCPSGITALGGLLTYSGSVSNAGNVTLNNVLVVNDRTGNTAVFTVASLAPGAVANFTGSYTVPANNGCSITSTLTASGSDKCTATAVSANATSTCSVAGSPQLAVTITCPPSAVALGGTLTFGGTVRNSGNITLTNVVVRRDAPASATPVFTVATLAPGASANFSGSYTVPVTDACSTVTTVTATANDQCAGAAIVANNSITCPIITAPRIVVTQACPPTPASPGGLLTYSGSVSNAGNVTLTNILVSNTQGTSPVFSLPSLAPGATANFTGSFVAPLNACSVTSTLEATGQDQCSASTVRNSVTSTCPLVTTPQIVVTKACPPQPVSAGGTLVFTGTVTNTGNITLNNVIVVNNQPSANTVVIGPITLAPGTGTNFTGSYTAPLNVCSVTDTLTATGRDQCGNTTVTNAVTATCPINTQPQVAITLVCPPAPVATGSLITYTGTVRNSGNVTLNNVTVVNDSAQPSTVLVVASLAPGASTNFTTSFTAPANACDLTTTVRVQGADSCNGLLASNTASATCPLITTPRIEITQNCPPTPATAGGLFNFSGTVRNTGNITLTNITVLSSRGAGSTNISPANGLVGYWTFNESTGTVANDSSGAGNHGNIINGIRKNGVSGNALNFNSTSSTVDIANSPSLNFAGPITLVALVKPFTTNGIQDIVAHGYTTNAPAGAVFLRINNGRYEVGSWNGTDSPVASAPIPAGDINTYVTLVGVYNGSNWTLYRNGSVIASANSAIGAVQINARWALGSRGGGGERFLNAELDEVRIYNRPLGTAEVATVGQPPTTTPPVTTPGVSTPVVTIATLAPGATANYNGSFTVPLDAGCSITSTVTVSGADICTGTRANATDTITCPLATLPDIEVTHSCPTGTILQGSLLTYTGTVRNTGNSTLTNVVVTSDRPGANTVIFTTASLAPGASANFSGSYQVPTNCCVVSSTVAASGRDCNGTLVTDTDTSTCTVTTTPRLAVTKTCPTTPVAPGETLRYSGTVRNTGDIVLFNVTVSNNQPGNGSVLLGPISLAPGEVATYEAEYVVPADFCGTDTVTARGLDACVFTPATDSVTTTCPITLRPRIAITKDCPTVPTPPGDIFTFTGRVSNTGNVALTNVFVFNNMPSNNTPVIGPITLAPGESREFSGSYVSRHCCCIIVDTITATGRDRCGGTIVSATATAACQLLSTPRIAVTQNCATTQVPAGGVFTFTGTVSNLGDGVLTNVFVFSNQGGANVSVLGPIELAVGEVKTFSGSYTVTATSNPAVNFLAATGTDACSTRTVTARANCAGPILQQVTAPVLNPIVSANGVVTLSWSATPGATYTLQSKAATETATWTDLPGNVTATGNTASKTDVMTPGQHRIYRVKVMPQQ